MIQKCQNKNNFLVGVVLLVENPFLLVYRKLDILSSSE